MNQVAGVEGSVTISLRDEAGRVVHVAWQRQDTPAGPVFRFENLPPAAGVREGVFRIVVRSGSQVLTDHEHRFSFRTS